MSLVIGVPSLVGVSIYLTKLPSNAPHSLASLPAAEGTSLPAQGVLDLSEDMLI